MAQAIHMLQTLLADAFHLPASRTFGLEIRVLCVCVCVFPRVLVNSRIRAIQTETSGVLQTTMREVLIPSAATV